MLIKASSSRFAKSRLLKVSHWDMVQSLPGRAMGLLGIMQLALIRPRAGGPCSPDNVGWEYFGKKSAGSICSGWLLKRGHAVGEPGSISLGGFRI